LVRQVKRFQLAGKGTASHILQLVPDLEIEITPAPIWNRFYFSLTVVLIVQEKLD
jgi:hypothetical protein